MPDTDSRPLLSLIIPAFNEQERIPKTLERVFRYLDAQGYAYEILVVDDGSQDETCAVVEPFQKAHPQLQILKNQGNRGKGYSVKRGMLAARGQYLLFSDADLSAPIEEAGKLLALVQDGCDVAIGSRALLGSDIQARQPWYRETMGKTFNKFVRLLAVGGIGDTQCGFKMFRAEAARRLFSRQRFARFSFDVEILWLARKYGCSVKEIPVVWRHVPQSRVHPITDASLMLLDLFRLRLNDFMGKYD